MFLNQFFQVCNNIYLNSNIVESDRSGYKTSFRKTNNKQMIKSQVKTNTYDLVSF